MPSAQVRIAERGSSYTPGAHRGRAPRSRDGG
jgi:hypothetical protein